MLIKDKKCPSSKSNLEMGAPQERCSNLTRPHHTSASKQITLFFALIIAGPIPLSIDDHELGFTAWAGLRPGGPTAWSRSQGAVDRRWPKMPLVTFKWEAKAQQWTFYGMKQFLFKGPVAFGDPFEVNLEQPRVHAPSAGSHPRSPLKDSKKKDGGVRLIFGTPRLTAGTRRRALSTAAARRALASTESGQMFWEC
ncbi:hypothetical protein EVAR_31597_1 [Eumeta japonica]|uniref:Uncharacterized protein n=1 Tax=Eumeta variegata TaxID=151549 RepID=A0A4C1VZB8_EUMVA|nr:hypothetical protein EVAR_31597_1 [Eumeta japonica]